MTQNVLELPVAFADARAADLGLHLGLAPQPALAVRTVDGDGWTAELRILGASHQVLVGHGERRVCSETVACHLPSMSPRLAPLPDRYRHGLDYEFRSRIDHLEPADFRSAVEDLLHHQPDDGAGQSLCARFPGDELGATAVRLDLQAPDATSLHWHTWHTYPRTGEVVTTSSRFALAVGSSAGRT